MVVFVVKVGEICCTDLDDFLVRRPMSFGSHVAPVPACILPSQTRTFLVCSSSLLKRGVHVLSQGTLLRSRSLIGATNVNYRVKVVQTKTNTRQHGMSSLMPRSSSNSNARIVVPPKPSSKLSNSKRDNSAGHSEVNKDILGSSLALPSSFGHSRVIGDAKHVCRPPPCSRWKRGNFLLVRATVLSKCSAVTQV